jgi:lipid A 3-O-deacylase
MLLPSKLMAESSNANDNANRGVHLDEIAIGSGYAWGHLKFTGSGFDAVPLYLRFGFDMNSLFGMKESKGMLQFALEPFYNPVTNPGSGAETGLDLFIRYLHPIAPSVKLLSEIGSGLMYLSVNTEEQGKRGFNFLNQFGLGTQIAVSRNSAITVGYRFRHLSNAGTSQPNRGINSNAVVLSYSLLF